MSYAFSVQEIKQIQCESPAWTGVHKHKSTVKAPCNPFSITLPRLLKPAGHGRLVS
jgi:hypothetical protein